MQKSPIATVALLGGLLFSNASFAETISKRNYQLAQEKIETTVKAEKSACASFSGNAKDICIVQASGKATVARAELDASYRPSPRAHFLVRTAKANADYALAKERCDDLAGTAKDICRKEAKAAQISARADAEAQLRTTNARASAKAKSVAALDEADSTAEDARNAATREKKDANYAVAKEKCDTFSGEAKDNCLYRAKEQFAKP